MDCVYLNDQGKTVPMVMGCYGIGVTRTFASIVEQHHDEEGIVFPLQVPEAVRYEWNRNLY